MFVALCELVVYLIALDRVHVVFAVIWIHLVYVVPESVLAIPMLGRSLVISAFLTRIDLSVLSDVEYL